MKQAAWVVAALGAVLAGAGPPAGAEDGDLQVLEARVRFRGGEGGRSGVLRLEGDLAVPSGILPFDPRTMQVGLSLGPAALSGEIAPGSRTRVREFGNGDWEVRTRRAFDGRGSLRFRMRPAAGTFTVRARGFTAEDLHAGGPEGVDCAVRLGEEAWSASIPFESPSDREWVFRHVPHRDPPPGGGGGGGGGGAPPPGTGNGFQTFHQGTDSGITTSRFEVITDPARWNQVWTEHTAGMNPAPMAVPVDFSVDMVVGWWLGTRSTGGYAAVIEAVVPAQILGAPGTPRGVVVSLREDRPGAHCLVTQALTSPFHIVLAPRNPGGSMTESSVRVRNCP